MTSIISSKRKSLLVLLAAFAFVVGVAACGGGGDDNGGSSNATSATTAAKSSNGSGVAVTIEGFAFDAKPVKAGQSFQVQNKDSTEHTFTANDGTFDVDVPAGKTVTVDALNAGTYKFHCKIHTSMTGTLEVS
jgi:plastocyanin